MRDSKKAVLCSTIFVLIVSMISICIIEPYHQTDFTSFSDWKYRESVRGTIDYLVVGSSHSMTGLYMPTIDEELNCNSCNLSGTVMTFRARNTILNEEIGNNPVKTVVLEIAYNALQADSYNAECNYSLIQRLGSFKKRMEYIVKNEIPQNYDVMYAAGINHGIHTLIRMAYLAYKNIGSDDLIQKIKDGCSSYDYNKTAGIRLTGTDVSLKENIADLYNSVSYSTDYNEDNFKYIEKMVSACREVDAEVIFVVTPIADSEIWEYKDMDMFYSKMKELSKKYNAPLFDFNLLKNRYEILNDEESFSDVNHMCIAGAQAFTLTYCDVMNKYNSGEDISDLFYSSYEEMKADSPYWAFMN